MALQGKLDELDERIIQDQRMVRAIEKWAACMAEKGYRYEEPEEIDTDLIERFKAIVGSRCGRAPRRRARRATDRAALAELQPDEVKIARADLECEKSTSRPLRRRSAAVRGGVPQRTHCSQVRPVGGQ